MSFCFDRPFHRFKTSHQAPPLFQPQGLFQLPKEFRRFEPPKPLRYGDDAEDVPRAPFPTVENCRKGLGGRNHFPNHETQESHHAGAYGSGWDESRRGSESQAMDNQDRKIILAGPKSGKESEVVFIPQKVADRLKEYVKESGAGPEQRLFPISYNEARIMVRKAGRLVGIHLRPHDLRRHAATLASRSGTLIEIVSKVIMRHAHLSTTQRYLGKVTDVEAMRWIENLYG
jgi:hypothetical protein